MKKITIGNKIVGENQPCIISFEPSSTYTNFDEAKLMIDASAKAGADAIKFQTFVTGDSDRMMGQKNLTVNFTTATGKKTEFVYDAFKRRELSADEWIKLAKYSKEKGLLFISSPYFPESVYFLKELGVDAFKVSKGDINNVLLINEIAKTKIPIILDGREKFEDVEKAIKICNDNDNDDIIIMHCPSGYPAENSGVHLNAIKAIKEKYDYPVGFADHSQGGLMNYAAISLGVSILEITITTDKSTEHVEHFMSLELDELEFFVKNIRSIEDAMGNAEILKTSRVSEDTRRSLVAKRGIKKGEKILLEHVDYKRPGNCGISCSEGFEVIGKTALSDIPSGSFLQWTMLK